MRIAATLRIALLLASCGGSLALHAAQGADVSVRLGPTDIPGGEARGAGDITLRNNRLAVAFAVETAAPWGVARGGIIDVAEVRGGVLAPDRASLVDFMPDNWSGWPTSYQRVIVEKNTPQEAILRTERDWGEVELVTTWTLKAGESRLRVHTQMRNTGKEPRAGLLSGYVLWPEGGHLFGVPGAYGQVQGKLESPGADWSAAYDEDWVMGLHAPFADRIDNDARDRYMLHDLAPGGSRGFEAWFEVGATGALAPLVATEIALRQLPAGQLSGEVTTRAGTVVGSPAVLVRKESGQRVYPYTWAVGDKGHYRLALPAGRYQVQATARGHASSAPVTLELRAGQDLQQDFRDLEPPGELAVEVLDAADGAALDARIRIVEGETPLVAYLGQSGFFTALDARGRLAIPLAPGAYRVEVAASAGFRARPLLLGFDILPGASHALQARIERLADPAARGWYAGDMHHHSDVLDGFTAPHFVLRSQLAAGLDIAFLSDHDSVANNREMQRLAAGRGLPFIAASEFSPSWAHFNAYPLDADATIGIDIGRSTVQQIFAEARRMGARILQINHPFIDYGYFQSHASNTIPGGYSADFDLVELGVGKGNAQIAAHTWALWNAGQRAYFSAGSDAHDVWRETSGEARMYAKVEGALTVDAFVAALRAGHAYASQGPLVYPQRMFGEEVLHAPGTPLALGFEVQAVNGLASVTLIERGEALEVLSFAAPTAVVPANFSVRPRHDTWYSLVVTDAAGRQAYTNPIWVRTLRAAR